MIGGWLPFTRALPGQTLESRLGEMFVECERGLDTQSLHHDKRHAVGEGIAFVGMVGEFAPCLGEYGFIDMNQGCYPACEQRLADFYRFGVMPAVIEECHHLIENIRGGYECDSALLDFTPGSDGGGMMLIVCRFQRDKESRIEKIGRHDPPYRYAS